MKQSVWLYGDEFDAKGMCDMKYPEALEYKNSCAKALINLLIEEPYAHNSDRIHDASKAISWNNYLITEALGKDPEHLV